MKAEEEEQEEQEGIMVGIVVNAVLKGPLLWMDEDEEELSLIHI